MPYKIDKSSGYYFQLLTGESKRTQFSPKEIASLYCFDAFNEQGNPKVILTEQVDFKSFAYCLF